MGSKAIPVPKKKEKEALSGAERKQLVNDMTKQVLEEMAGPDSLLRMNEAEVAEDLKGKGRDEQNGILDDFAEELSGEYPFVGEWKVSLKPATYMDENGNEVKGQMILDRKTLEKNVRRLVEGSVDNLLGQVAEMKVAAENGETSRATVELGLEGSGAGEFNASVAKALVENLPKKLEGNIKVDADKNKKDEYTGNVRLSWVGEMGSKDVKISLFTGKPVGSTKKA